MQFLLPSFIKCNLNCVTTTTITNIFNHFLTDGFIGKVPNPKKLNHALIFNKQILYLGMPNHLLMFITYIPLTPKLKDREP